MLPYDIDTRIIDIEKLKKELEETIKMIIKKAQELKVLQKISKSEELEYKILKNIFSSRIIKLEDTELKLTKEKDTIYLQLFDENLFENKIEIGTKEDINPKELKHRINKKVKIFE